MHYGCCRKKRMHEKENVDKGRRDQPDAASAASEVANEDAVRGTTDEEREEDEDAAAFCDADEAWLRLFYQRCDLKTSLLDDVLQLTKLGPTTFKSAQQMMAAIDALPGPEFRTMALHIHGIETPYTLMVRDLLEVVNTILQRCNGCFRDPVEGDEGDKDPAGGNEGDEGDKDPAGGRSNEGDEGDFVDGERFKHLCKKFREAVGPDADAILMPVVLSSGGYPLPCLAVCMTCAAVRMQCLAVCMTCAAVRI